MSKKTSVLLVAACSASMLASSAFAAVDLTPSVINANMEFAGAGQVGLLADGQDNYPSNQLNPGQDGWKAWANSANGNMLRMWNPSATDRSSTQNNQFFDTSWGGVAPQGDQVIAVRTQHFDYVPSTGIVDTYGNRTFSPTAGALGLNGETYDWQTDDGGVAGVGGIRNFEAAAQQLAETFDPSARYELTVQVGRLHEDGFNAGLVTATGVASTRFANDAPVLWNGYTVDLMAGGTTNAAGSSFSGWVYGNVTDPNAADYIGMIEQDNSSLALAADTWGLSTVTYSPTPGNNMAALAGKNLVIRLSALEPALHVDTAAVAFDDVKLVKYLAGDVDQDNDIDDADFGLSFSAFTGPGANTRDWFDGDFDGDGDVDDADFGISFAKFTGPGVTASVPEPTSLALLGLGGLLIARRRRA